MLRGASLRITRPRLTVLGVVHDEPHADTHSIIERVRSELGLDDAALADLARTAVDASFAQATTKARLRAEIDAWLS